MQAEAGVFPGNAQLSVARVPVRKRREAEKAVEEVRDEDVNVVVSYAFNIKVIDPDTRQELQPADGEHVSISFACEKVADANLDTSVYHIDDTGEAEKLDVVTEEETTDGSAPSATVETEGFSTYVVEFTHLPLVYRASLTSEENLVLVSEIILNLGLTGTYTEVNSGQSGTTVYQIVMTPNGDTAIRIDNEGTEYLYVTINDSELEITVNAIQMDTHAVSSWAQLQAALNAGGYVKLLDDITAASDEEGLVVPAGKTVVLNLLGCTLSRGLEYAENDGYVIKNHGTLTITSYGTGVITGGISKGITEDGRVNSYNFGGGIHNYGTLTLEDVTITGNAAVGDASGGGIYNAGTLHLNGGCITNNVGIGGGGIYNEGNMTVSGAPVVKDNDGYRGGNLLLNWENMLEVTGPLLYGAELYVEALDDRTVITKGYRKYNQEPPRYFFHADNEAKSIFLTASTEKGEVGLGISHTITVVAGEGFTVDVAASAMAGDSVPLTITTPEDIGMRGFWVNDEWHRVNLDPDDHYYNFTMPNEDVTLRVGSWNEITTETKTRIVGTYQNNTYQYLWNNHATLTPDKKVAADGDTVTLTLTAEEGYGPIDNDSIQIFKRYPEGPNAWYAVGRPVEGADNTWTFTMPRDECDVYAVAEIEWKNTPPSGKTTPYFFIDEECTNYGKVTASGGIGVGFANRNIPLNTTITLDAVPNDGYALKGWEVVQVTRKNGATVPVENGYTLPVEFVEDHYELNFDKVDGLRGFWFFSIRAIFEPARTPISLEIYYYDAKGTTNRGSSLAEVDPPVAYYAGDTMRVRANLVEGAAFRTYTRRETGQEMRFPEIFYTPRDNASERYKYIDDPQWDEEGKTFSFVVPEDVHPNEPKIIIHASFEDSESALYRVIPFSDDQVTVAVGYHNPVSEQEVEVAPGETVQVTVTAKDGSGFKPREDLSAEYYENGASHGVDCTLLNSSTNVTPGATTYNYTFVMPAHDVYVSAQKADYTFRVRWADDVTEKPATISVARQRYVDGAWQTVAVRTVSAANGWKTSFTMASGQQSSGPDANATNNVNANSLLMAGKPIILRGDGDGQGGGSGGSGGGQGGEPVNRIRILDDDGNVLEDNVGVNPDDDLPGEGANFNNVSHDENVEVDANYDLDYDIDGKNTDAHLLNQSLKLRFPVEVIWVPDDNAPISVRVQLQHQAAVNGPWAALDGKTATLSDNILDDESWKHTFELDVDKIEGNYRVRQLNGNAALEEGSVVSFNNNNYTVAYDVDYSNFDMGYTTIINQGPRKYKAKIVWPADAPAEAIPQGVIVQLQKRTNNGPWEVEEPITLTPAGQWEGTFNTTVEPVPGVEWRVREIDDSGETVGSEEDIQNGENLNNYANFKTEDGVTEVFYNKITYDYDPATGLTTITNGNTQLGRQLTAELKWDDGDEVSYKKEPVTVVCEKYNSNKNEWAAVDNLQFPEHVFKAGHKQTFSWNVLCEPGERFRVVIKARVGNVDDVEIQNDGDWGKFQVYKQNGHLELVDYIVHYEVEGNKTTITNKLPGKYKAKIVWPQNVPAGVDIIPDQVRVELQKKVDNQWVKQEDELILNAANHWEGTFSRHIAPPGED